jgi:PAS domain S-box-containing protein
MAAPDGTETPLDLRALREIVEGTAAETGEAFFDELVKHLAHATGKKCAWVTEWVEDGRRLRALSFWAGDRYITDYEYGIPGTPCEPVVEECRLVFVPDRVLELYPSDTDIVPLGAVSYLGIPLLDTDGGLLGHLAVLDDKPMEEDEGVLGIFRIFAGRAGAELRRLRRDRDLKERERRLSALFDSAMDAIVEVDKDLRITGMNAAAERVFRCDGAVVVGQGLDAFLGQASRGKLGHLMAELERQPEGRQSLWIPDGIEGARGDGGTFPADATLSRFELKGHTFFTLILRDADERLAAEERVRSLTNETAYLRAEIERLRGFDDIVGESDALRHVLADVDRVAGTDATVLLTGETGTGKELVARAIHRKSARAKGPLVTVNCAAVPANLQESELFGHEKGAFTGALQRRDGRFKLADKGTIFLDEVGEMAPELQAKLLRVLQEGEVEPLGGTRTIRVDVRVVAATNRDLAAMVKEGTFRADLLYRLNVFPLHMPPLRERGDDVVLLAEAFARQFARKGSGRVAALSPDAKARLRRYEWPGNVRELRNVIERALITSTDGRTLNLERALPEASAPVAPAREPERVLTVTELEDLERRNLSRALDAAGWKISGVDGAARMLGLNPNTLSSRMKKLGIRKPGERS